MARKYDTGEISERNKESMVGRYLDTGKEVKGKNARVWGKK